MVGMPRPSSPISSPSAPTNSTSLDALERLPSLSLSCWIWIALRLPSRAQRGTRKQLKRSVACDKIRARRNGAQIRSALIFRHAHAEEHAGFLGSRTKARIILASEDAWQPFGGQGRRVTERRHRAIGHGNRAVH